MTHYLHEGALKTPVPEPPHPHTLEVLFHESGLASSTFKNSSGGSNMLLCLQTSVIGEG